MAPWVEFEGRYRREETADGSRLVLDTKKKRQLKDGEEVVIAEKKGGLFRNRRDGKVTVRIVDADQATVTIERPHEPLISAGEVINKWGGGFGFALEHYEFTGNGSSLVQGFHGVRKQDVWHCGQRGNMHGVMWVNELGERERTISITPGRSFYDSDTDEEARKVVAEAKEREAKLADGRIQTEILASAGGFSVGFEYEQEDREQEE